MFAIDATDPTPLYAKLDRAIRVALATGRLRAGDRVPTVRQLAVDLRINANTVAKVYGELERAGMLESRRGVGTYVRATEAGAVSQRDRARQLAALAERFLAEAASFGFSADDLVQQLQQMREERGNTDA